jgi:hypothetical protein
MEFLSPPAYSPRGKQSSQRSDQSRSRENRKVAGEEESPARTLATNLNRQTRSTVYRLLIQLVIGCLFSTLPEIRADIPWPEVVHRLAYENQRLARRPQGHAGEYFVVCTLYYTPMESGFTFERGFDAVRVTKPGLHGHTYPRDFLRSVKKEGFGRIIKPVNARNYIRYNGRDSFAFASGPTGGGGSLVARLSAAVKPGQSEIRHGVTIETAASAVRDIFGSTRWKIVDTGGGLRRWQIDLYYGEDEPLGPGRFMARPRGTTFEYAYSDARVSN